jgi:hypothetical protein
MRDLIVIIMMLLWVFFAIVTLYIDWQGNIIAEFIFTCAVTALYGCVFKCILLPNEI